MFRNECSGLRPFRIRRFVKGGTHPGVESDPKRRDQMSEIVPPPIRHQSPHTLGLRPGTNRSGITKFSRIFALQVLVIRI